MRLDEGITANVLEHTQIAKADYFNVCNRQDFECCQHSKTVNVRDAGYTSYLDTIIIHYIYTYLNVTLHFINMCNYFGPIQSEF